MAMRGFVALTAIAGSFVFPEIAQAGCSALVTLSGGNTSPAAGQTWGASVTGLDAPELHPMDRPPVLAVTSGSGEVKRFPLGRQESGAVYAAKLTLPAGPWQFAVDVGAPKNCYTEHVFSTKGASAAALGGINRSGENGGWKLAALALAAVVGSLVIVAALVSAASTPFRRRLAHPLGGEQLAASALEVAVVEPPARSSARTGGDARRQ
jgi:hypothetical protein